MTLHDHVSDVCDSPNGDRWTLARKPNGELVVCHFPNRASGGVFSETHVNVFLRQKPRGPEHQALATILANLSESSGQNLEAETVSQLNAALGLAAVRYWSSLQPETQHSLFEAAVMSLGETMRPSLARYLHEKHQRTLNIAEPDSLGG